MTVNRCVCLMTFFQIFYLCLSDKQSHLYRFETTCGWVKFGTPLQMVPSPEVFKDSKTQFGICPYSTSTTTHKNCLQCPGIHPEHFRAHMPQFYSEYIKSCFTFIHFSCCLEILPLSPYRPNIAFIFCILFVYFSLLPQRSRLAGPGHFAGLNDSVWVQERATPVTFTVCARFPVPTCAESNFSSEGGFDLHEGLC